MRILVSGYHNPHYATITEYVERAVERLGHETVSFDDRGHIFPGRLRERIPILEAISLAVINRNLVRIAERVRPGLVLVIGGHRIRKPALHRLIRSGVPVVLWTTDAPRATDVMPDTAPLYTRVFCQGTEYVDILRRRGVAGADVLPMACDPEVHRRVDVSTEDHRAFASEVAFVGSWYENRADVLRSAAHRPLAIWGPGWERRELPSALQACVRGAHTPPEKWVRIYSASKIVLALHYVDPEGRYPVHQASPRVFEAMACGAFVLSDRQRDVFALFRDGEHLVSFSGSADLDRKIAYYLEHEDERLRIAAAGRAEVLRHHTYAHRVEQLLNPLPRAGGHPADYRGAERPVAPSPSGAHGGPVL
jgi:spore maturation protein CgeB